MVQPDINVLLVSRFKHVKLGFWLGKLTKLVVVKNQVSDDSIETQEQYFY